MQNPSIASRTYINFCVLLPSIFVDVFSNNAFYPQQLHANQIRTHIRSCRKYELDCLLGSLNVIAGELKPLYMTDGMSHVCLCAGTCYFLRYSVSIRMSEREIHPNDNAQRIIVKCLLGNKYCPDVEYTGNICSLSTF